ncbi:MAG: 6-hydroxymethylpterin diphosphokinase MptE-like protein, partial [Candidatus Hermodarchaeota archaeon]
MINNYIKKIDFYPHFEKWYYKILKTFKFDPQKDNKAAKILSNILEEKGKSWNLAQVLKSFENYIHSKNNLFIYGCGPSLEQTVKKLKEILGEAVSKLAINLAADGASKCLDENDIPIDAIFTDLDGISEGEFFKPKYIIVHAHGDNIEKLLKFKKSIIKFENIIGTVQVNSSELTINPGGFTDGDRILFFLRSMLLPQHKIYLIGMDFKDKVGKYSKPYLQKNQKATKIKQKKLK